MVDGPIKASFPNQRVPMKSKLLKREEASSTQTSTWATWLQERSLRSRSSSSTRSYGISIPSGASASWLKPLEMPSKLTHRTSNEMIKVNLIWVLAQKQQRWARHHPGSVVQASPITRRKRPLILCWGLYPRHDQICMLLWEDQRRGRLAVQEGILKSHLLRGCHNFSSRWLKTWADQMEPATPSQSRAAHA